MNKYEFIEKYGIDKYNETLVKARERRKKYQAEHHEEYLEKCRERNKKYRAENKEKVHEYHNNWNANNKDKRQKYVEDYKDKHPNGRANATKKYRQNNHDKILAYKKESYYNHKPTRAYSLYRSYKRADDLRRGGGCTITKEWILENVYSGQTCCYCGCSDWHKLGVDRIDNNKPHTPDNVVVSCSDCNFKRGEQNYYSFRYGVKDWGELMKQLRYGTDG